MEAVNTCTVMFSHIWTHTPASDFTSVLGHSQRSYVLRFVINKLSSLEFKSLCLYVAEHLRTPQSSFLKWLTPPSSLCKAHASLLPNWCNCFQDIALRRSGKQSQRRHLIHERKWWLGASLSGSTLPRPINTSVIHVGLNVALLCSFLHYICLCETKP